MVGRPAIQYTQTDDGVNIAYTVEHNGPGTPVISLRSIVNHLEYDSFVANRQGVHEGRTIIRFDPRCQGLSDRDVPDISLSARTLDFLAVQRAVGVEKLAILAGGTTVWPAVAYANNVPDSVSHLMFIHATISGEDYWHGGIDAADALVSFAKRNYFEYTEARAWLTYRASGAATEAIMNYGAMFRAAINEQDFLRLYAADLEIDISAELQRLSIPALASSSTGVEFMDSTEAARRFARATPGVHLVSQPVSEAFDSMARFVDDDSSAAQELKPLPNASPGLRSIMFTDIEGHTEMMERLGDERGRELLRTHERVTRDALKEHGGTEVKAMGDGFMSWFPSATAALRCAASLQKAFEDHSERGERIRIRAGINAGEPMEEDDDLFGTSVIVAARTAASAAGGQIVVTDVVRQLVAGKEFLFADRGLSNLKGFEDPVRTWEVLW